MKWLVIVWVFSFNCYIGQGGVMFFHQWSEFSKDRVVTFLKCSYKTIQENDTPPPYFIGIQNDKNRVFAQVTSSSDYVKIDPPYSDRWEGVGHADGVFADAYILLTNHNVSFQDSGRYFCEGRYKIDNSNVVVHMNLTALEFDVEESGADYETVDDSMYAEYK